MTHYESRSWPALTKRRLSIALLAVAALGALLAPHLNSPDSGIQHWGAALKDGEAANEVTGDDTTSFRELAPGGGKKWRLVVPAADDFNGAQLNPTTWHAYSGPGNAGHGVRDPSAISVSGGALHITGSGDVAGGMAQDHSQLYGRWVVRARMEPGQGYGPAILLWPDSENWPEDGEIDIVEMPRADRKQAVMSAHWAEDNKQVSQEVKGDFTQWHTYAVDWLPDRILYYIDGHVRYRVTKPEAIPHKPMHLAIQNDVGKCGSWIGCRDATTPEKVSLHVDAVRVYELR